MLREKCDKNISNENYAKLNYLSKKKELDQIVLQKGLSTSRTGHLCLTKGHLNNPEGRVEGESPPPLRPPNSKLFSIRFTDI